MWSNGPCTHGMALAFEMAFASRSGGAVCPASRHRLKPRHREHAQVLKRAQNIYIGSVETKASLNGKYHRTIAESATPT